MRFFIYCPGMPITPEVMTSGSLGGSESSGFYLSRQLVREGHEVILFTNIQQEASHDGVPLIPIGPQNEQFPLGQNFQEKAQTIPHDVLLFQRDPRGLHFRPNARLVFFWAHDLGRERNRGVFHNQGFRYDGIMAVSEFHADQLSKALSVKRDKIHILRNAPDLDLFKAEPNPERKFRGKKIVYISRPERGLEYLVKPGGIMEKLNEIDPDITLCVAHYDNTAPDMAPKYNALWQRCNDLPNVALMGCLSKRGVADLMYDAAALCYPVLDPDKFEETSCIALMEAQSAGCLVISGKSGAIPETMGAQDKIDGLSLVEYEQQIGPLPEGIDEYVDVRMNLIKHKNDEQYIQEFVWSVEHLFSLRKHSYTEGSKAARKYAIETYQWEKSVEALLVAVGGLLRDRCKSVPRLLNHYLDNSDFTAAQRLLVEEDYQPTPRQQREIDLYQFMDTSKDYSRHYARSAELMMKYTDDDTRYATQESLGGHLGQLIEPHVQALATRGGGKVLDYGCGLGHMVLFFAEKYPMLKFTGADIAKSNVEAAKMEAKKRGLDNIRFTVSVDPHELGGTFDLVMCLETVEHVREDACIFFSKLEKITNKGRRVVVAYPSGPPEPYERKEGEEERMEHVRFIESFEIREMLKNKQGVSENYFSRAASSKDEIPVGGCVVSWQADHKTLGEYVWGQKRWHQAPRDTLAVCMIVRSDTITLGKTLDSLQEIADEIILRIDGGDDIESFNLKECNAYKIGKEYGATMIVGQSPTIIGFAAARNESIANAQSDWILWIDDDESFVWPRRLLKYLKPSFYDSYSIHHHHFSCEPAGLMKTDLPTRLFRNHCGFQFHGFVHEHPEIGEMNNGPGDVHLIPPNQSAIMHVGYESEEVRRKRFERNWPLMDKDHKENPGRKLGIFLYMRDLVHQIRFALEQGRDTPESRHAIIDEGLVLWREMIKDNQIRFATDALPFVSELMQYDQRSSGIVAKVGFDLNYQGAGGSVNPQEPVPYVTALFPTSEDIIAFANALINDRLQLISGKYF